MGFFEKSVLVSPESNLGLGLMIPQYTIDPVPILVSGTSDVAHREIQQTD